MREFKDASKEVHFDKIFDLHFSQSLEPPVEKHLRWLRVKAMRPFGLHIFSMLN